MCYYIAKKKIQHLFELVWDYTVLNRINTTLLNKQNNFTGDENDLTEFKQFCLSKLILY